MLQIFETSSQFFFEKKIPNKISLIKDFNKIQRSPSKSSVFKFLNKENLPLCTTFTFHAQQGKFGLFEAFFKSINHIRVFMYSYTEMNTKYMYMTVLKKSKTKSTRTAKIIVINNFYPFSPSLLRIRNMSVH